MAMHFKSEDQCVIQVFLVRNVLQEQGGLLMHGDLNQ